jgi:hypothetical protein
MKSGVSFLAAQGVLGEENDKDFFKFTAKKGDWVNFLTEANPDDDPMMVDTVLTVFDADGKTQLAEADDAYPRGTTPDSSFNFRIPADGTYCLQVQEFSTWKGMASKFDPSFAYAAVVVPYTAENLAVLKGFDPEKEDNNTTPQKLTNLFTAMSGQVGDSLFGALEPKTDKDRYEFTTPAGALGVSLNFEPGGTTGNGGTGGIGLVNLLSGDGNTIIAQLNYADATATLEAGGSYGMGGVPVMPATKYLLEVNRNAGEVGSNDFYFFQLGTAGQLNDQEQNDAANNVSTAAETATGMPNMNNPKATNRFIGGTIPANDVDFWKFDANANEALTVVCSSRRAGSGVADFTVALYKDPAQAALQSETETATKDLLWNDDPSASMPGIKTVKGSYFLKLSSTMVVSGGATSSHYLCGIHTLAP